MSLKLRQNAVLAGLIDYFCLVCESHIKTEDEIDSHVVKTLHKKNLDASPVVEKFSNDHIIKVKKGYYCIFCNSLFSTMTKVGLHVNEKQHLVNKGNSLLQRHGDFISAFGEYLITDYAWNGIVDETCALCNVEFDDADVHISDANHILKLVQNQVAFGESKDMYRVVDDNAFHCLTCNKVFALDTMTVHFQDSGHKEILLECMKSYKELELTPVKSIKVTEVNNNSNNGAVHTELQKPITCVGKEKTETKVEDKKKKSNESKPLNGDDDDPTKFAKDNNITYNRGVANAFCRVCEIKLPANIRSLKEHVAGNPHKNKLSQISKAPKTKTLNKKYMKEFADEVLTIKNMFFTEKVVDEKLCLDGLSYDFMSKNGGRLRCQLCEENLTPGELDEHIESSGHAYGIAHTPVLTSFENEFIREVRPDLYHCAFCNLILASLEDLENHLKCSEHKLKKGEREFRLRARLPEVAQYKARRDMHFMMGLAALQRLFD